MESNGKSGKAKLPAKLIKDLHEACGTAAYIVMPLKMLAEPRRIAENGETFCLTITRDWFDDIAEDVALLNKLLNYPKVAESLSLANPYPVQLAGVIADSYVEAITTIGERLIKKMRESEPLEDGDIPTCDGDPAVELGPLEHNHCYKEFQRATGVAFDSFLEREPIPEPASMKVLELLAKNLDESTVAARVGKTADQVHGIAYYHRIRLSRMKKN